MRSRLEAHLRRVQGKHKDGQALLVVHGGIMRFMQSLDNGELVLESPENLAIVSFNVARMLQTLEQS